MGGGEPADERREGPMALPGRGEMRTRRGAEVTVGAEGRRRREAERAPGRAEGSGSLCPSAGSALPGPSGRPPRGQRWGPQGCAGSGASPRSSPPGAERGKRSSVS